MSDRAEEAAAREPPDYTGDALLLDGPSARGLVRLAAGAVWRTNAWTVGTALKATRRLGEAARSGESAAALFDDARDEFVAAARTVLGLADLEKRLPPPPSSSEEEAAEALRRRWVELEERSAEVDSDEAHPAFSGIFNSMAPDEARILRLLATDGPQAAVDVRTWRPLGIGSEVVAPGLTMIGNRAGCLHVERVPVYLSNLYRLGLIWFSRETMDDLGAYQVLEAQPEVIEALKEAGRGTTVRRSIALTPFGEQFCAAVLPAGTLEFEAITDPDAAARTDGLLS